MLFTFQFVAIFHQNSTAKNYDRQAGREPAQIVRLFNSLYFSLEKTKISDQLQMKYQMCTQRCWTIWCEL